MRNGSSETAQVGTLPNKFKTNKTHPFHTLSSYCTYAGRLGTFNKYCREPWKNVNGGKSFFFL